MRCWIVAVSLLLAPLASSAQGTPYVGARVVLMPSPIGQRAGFAARMRWRIAPLPAAQRSAQVLVNFGSSWVDTGLVSRWGDTIFVETWGRFGDSIFWLGSRRGAGYAGRYYQKSGVNAGEYGRWALNGAGDSMASGAAPRAGARDTLRQFFDSLASAAAYYSPPRVVAADDSSSPSTWLFGVVIGWWFLAFLYGRTKALRTRLRIRLRRRWRPSAPLHGYAVPCPICGKARMQQARVLHVVSGRFFFTALERRVVAGCTPCVGRESRRTVATALNRGVGSLGGLFAAPLYAAMDVHELFRRPDPRIVEELIRKAGLDPDEVRLDADGLTHVERTRFEIVSFVCATIIWANERRAPKAFDMSVAHIRGMFEGKLAAGRIGELLFNAHGGPSPECAVTELARAQMARLIRNLALADGPLTAQMSAAIHLVANTLGFSRNDITELFKEIGYAARGTSGAEEAQRQARENESRANGNQQRQEDPGARRQRQKREDLEKARILLGVSSTATYFEIERAYRTIIAACHPDRAGLDPRLQKLFTEKAQQITWAKEALRRSFQAQAS